MEFTAKLLKKAELSDPFSNTVTCKKCGKEILEVDAFPGQRCLECHAKWFDSIPLSQHAKPDFTKVVKGAQDRLEAVMAKQPKFPGDDEHPFVCTRCGEPVAEGAEGFIDKDGLPVHAKCSTYPGEVKAYQNANGGNGYQLDPKWFPAWH